MFSRRVKVQEEPLTPKYTYHVSCKQYPTLCECVCVRVCVVVVVVVVVVSSLANAPASMLAEVRPDQAAGVL